MENEGRGKEEQREGEDDAAGRPAGAISTSYFFHLVYVL